MFHSWGMMTITQEETFIVTLLNITLVFWSLSSISNICSVLFVPTQAYVHKSVMEELKRIIDDSEITKEDDALWPPPDRVGRQVCDLVFFSFMEQQKQVYLLILRCS